MGRTGNQLAQRGQFLSLHQMALQALLVLEAAPRILQQMDQRLVLQILAHEHEHAQHQHRRQYGKEAKRPRRSRRVVPSVGPQSQYRQGKNRQHRQPQRHRAPFVVRVVGAAASGCHSRAVSAVAAIQLTAPISGTS